MNTAIKLLFLRDLDAMQAVDDFYSMQILNILLKAARSKYLSSTAGSAVVWPTT